LLRALSVIVPVYNVENYLEACLDSILNQTYSNFEVICVDDASTDSSLNILRKMATNDSRIKILRLTTNKGLGNARNEGIKAAKGDFITFVDSDDTLDLQTHQRVMQVFDNDIDLVCFGMQITGDVFLDRRKDDENYYRIKFEGLQSLSDAVVLNTDVSACNKVFRKSIIDKYNILFPVGVLYEDASFYFCYTAVIKNAYFISEKFYHYHRRVGCIMAQTFDYSNRAIKDHLKVIENVFEFFVSHRLLIFSHHRFRLIFDAYVQHACRYSNGRNLKVIVLLLKSIAKLLFVAVFKSGITFLLR
jgi:glycosyltransferase involved in cell wall biosynthesis